jgi:hypothetical protein
MPIKRVKEIVVLALAAFVLSLPLFVYGPMSLAGHDTREHISFGTCFAEQFWQGELYPRWLLNMNHGLGSASFFVYPPFPSYVYALLLPVAGFAHLNAFSLGEYLCLFASGLCAFLWMTTIATTQVSLIAATIYMLLPYHLAIDFYRRDALSECWALAWMPLVLYFATEAARKKRYAVVGLAVAYALLIVSHLVSVAIFSALPLLLALVIAQRRRKTRALLTVAGGLALGVLIAAVYLVPAFASASHFPVSRLDIPIDRGPHGNLLDFGRDLFTGHSAKSGFVRAISLATVDTVLFAALCGCIAFKKSAPARRPQVLLWLAVCPIPIFLMSGPSQWLWKALPALSNAVQFPWRLDVVLCIAVLPLTAFLLTDGMRFPARSRVCILVVVGLFAATWLGGCFDAVKQLSRDRTDAGPEWKVYDGWFAAWTPPGTDLTSALRAAAEPPARFQAGQGSAQVLLWKPRHIEVMTQCETCGRLVVNQFYYPGWKAQLVPEDTPLLIKPALPQGLLAVQVPPGRHQIRFDLPHGLDEQIGTWMSAIGLLVTIALFIANFAGPKQLRQRDSTANHRIQ